VADIPVVLSVSQAILLQWLMFQWSFQFLKPYYYIGWYSTGPFSFSNHFITLLIFQCSFQFRNLYYYGGWLFQWSFLFLEIYYYSDWCSSGPFSFLIHITVAV
jgi:hypothetical protein